MGNAIGHPATTVRSTFRKKRSDTWLPRVQGVELEECRWLPAFLRDGITDALGLIMRALRAYEAAFPLLHGWADSSGSLLDMASGSGAHIRQLIRWSDRNGMTLPRIVVSDLFPNRARFEALARDFPGRVEALSSPLDAMAVPQALRQRPRSMFSAFHHLTPEQARAVLADAACHADGLFIFEPHPRTVRNLFANVGGLFFGMISPFFAARFSWKRLLFCTLVPVIPILLAFDGVVSVLRCYTAGEFEAMIRSLPPNDYEWEIVEIPAAGPLRFMTELCVTGKRREHECKTNAGPGKFGVRQPACPS